MRVLYLGDLHGNFNLIRQYVDRFNITDTHIIQVGDFGVGFDTLESERRRLEPINRLLSEKNIYLYAIRGNHDCPVYFDNDPFNLSNIKLVKDYTVLDLEDKRILCIGGAVSVDRRMTKTDAQLNGDDRYIVGHTWFKGEEFKYDDTLLKDLRGINTIVTHTAPDYCVPDNAMGFGPFVDRFIMIDPDLKIDLMEERRNMTLAFQTIKMNNDVGLHVYGHFHRSATLDLMGTHHRLLGIGELWEDKNNYYKV